MFAILTDTKGFHKVIPIDQTYPMQTIRFAAVQRPIAPPETEADLFESMEVNERTFHLERQVTHDTFLYRER